MKNHKLLTIAAALLLCASCTNDKKTENDYLSQQDIALFGDSMTWYGGALFELERGWSYHFFRSAQPKSLTTFARSGCTWTNNDSTKVDTEFYYGMVHDKNVIYNQVQRLILATGNGSAPTPDIILIYAGANDVWYGERRPNIFSQTAQEVIDAEPYAEGTLPGQVTSLAGSIRLSCEVLRRHFPSTRIVLMTPIEMSERTVDETARVANVIDSVGTALGLEVLRADKQVDIRHEVEKKQFTYTSDGVHSNRTGAKMIADFVETSLKKYDKHQ